MNKTIHPITETIKKKWVKALRSGNYQQARGSLKTTDGFCCLGVLREVAPLKCIAMCNQILAKKVKNEKCAFARLGSKSQESLANANDRGKTFAYIADFIERSTIEALTQ